MIRDTDITRAIVSSYMTRLQSATESDVLIAGAGPSGMVAATLLARAGAQVTLCEKRLAPGGGVWGGGMFMNVVVIQPEAKAVLDDLHLPCVKVDAQLHTIDSCLLAAGLCVRALEAGATILNAVAVEDVMIAEDRVQGLVLNRPLVKEGRLPVDPLMFQAKAVLDSTGHDAYVVGALARLGRKLKTKTGNMMGEGPMNAEEAERFVVEKTGEVFPGLFVSGMAVQATHGGPRMGPIFGGMLLSGKKAARRIGEAIGVKVK
ncbi:MAG: sulfide-dependent adenosine diphosphate thiazole synthase [Planctomycetota bacterium]|jgi:thiamine thiazole synthase